MARDFFELILVKPTTEPACPPHAWQRPVLELAPKEGVIVMVKVNLRRWSLEGLISLVVTAGLLSIIISSANAWMHMGRASVMDLRVFGLAFYQLTRTAGQVSGKTLNQGMGAVWLGGSLLLFGLLEARHHLIP
jgi:hypothetical protein